MKLEAKPGFDWSALTWGKPDSVETAICSCCSGGLPEVPLKMWAENGSCVTFCDACVKKWFHLVP